MRSNEIFIVDNLSIYEFNKLKSAPKLLYDFVSQYRDDIYDNLMKMSLKVTPHKMDQTHDGLWYSNSDLSRKHISDLVKTSYGWLICMDKEVARNLYSGNDTKDSMYWDNNHDFVVIGYIYVNEWCNKNEISFYLAKQFRKNLSISFDKILKMFMNKCEISLRNNAPLIKNNENYLITWGTRYRAKESIRLARLCDFNYAFSFYDAIPSFFDKNNVNNECVRKEWKAVSAKKDSNLIVTNYFYKIYTDKKHVKNNKVNKWVIDHQELVYDAFVTKLNKNINNVVMLRNTETDIDAFGSPIKDEDMPLFYVDGHYSLKKLLLSSGLEKFLDDSMNKINATFINIIPSPNVCKYVALVLKKYLMEGNKDLKNIIVMFHIFENAICILKTESGKVTILNDDEKFDPYRFEYNFEEILSESNNVSILNNDGLSTSQIILAEHKSGISHQISRELSTLLKNRKIQNYRLYSLNNNQSFENELYAFLHSTKNPTNTKEKKLTRPIKALFTSLLTVTSIIIPVFIPYFLDDNFGIKSKILITIACIIILSLIVSACLAFPMRKMKFGSLRLGFNNKNFNKNSIFVIDDINESNYKQFIDTFTKECIHNYIGLQYILIISDSNPTAIANKIKYEWEVFQNGHLKNGKESKKDLIYNVQNYTLSKSNIYRMVYDKFIESIYLKYRYGIAKDLKFENNKSNINCQEGFNLASFYQSFSLDTNLIKKELFIGKEYGFEMVLIPQTSFSIPKADYNYLKNNIFGILDQLVLNSSNFCNPEKFFSILNNEILMYRYKTKSAYNNSKLITGLILKEIMQISYLKNFYEKESSNLCIQLQENLYTNVGDKNLNISELDDKLRNFIFEHKHELNEIGLDWLITKKRGK